MGNLRSEIKRLGLVPDQKRNYWKRGVPQNPDTWAYKVYHFHLNNPPCPIGDLCRGIGVPIHRSHKVALIIERLRKAKTWRWPKRPDREQASRNVLESIASRYGEDV
jgi:hypothetical protein